MYKNTEKDSSVPYSNYLENLEKNFKLFSDIPFQIFF